ncbi:MAG: serine hydrolase domain-containing protein [Myxococcota bacterium]|nr:serine hydrolase domain-containing protein [Myxococcota bacterium]
MYTIMLMLGCVKQADTPLKSPIPENQVEKSLDAYFSALAENNFIQGSFIITQNGEPVFQKAYGFLDAKGKYVANTQTIYRIGSVSKTYTAVMIMQLVDEGKLTVDQTIDKWFPSIPKADQITVEHLLRHRSGLYPLILEEHHVLMVEPIGFEEMIERVASHDLLFEPGTDQQYNNVGYVLLGHLIETIDNQNLNESLQRRISKKVGAVNTKYGDQINVKKNEARSLDYGNEWVESKETKIMMFGGAGAMSSFPEDLCRFGESLFGGELVSDSSLRYMKDMSAGLWFNDENMYYGHGGGIDEFRSLLEYNEDISTCIAYTMNTHHYKPDALADVMKKAAKGEVVEIPNIENVKLSQETLQSYEGVYESVERPDYLIFIPHDGDLYIQESDAMEFSFEGEHAPLISLSNGVFAFFPYDLEIDFQSDGTEIKQEFYLRYGGETFHYKRLPRDTKEPSTTE